MFILGISLSFEKLNWLVLPLVFAAAVVMARMELFIEKLVWISVFFVPLSRDNIFPFVFLIICSLFFVGLSQAKKKLSNWLIEQLKIKRWVEVVGWIFSWIIWKILTNQINSNWESNLQI